LMSSMAGIIVIPILGILIKSLVTYGIAHIFEGKAKFKTTFSVIIFAYFINVLGEIIRSIIGLLTRSYLVTTSPALFLSQSDVNTPMFTLLSNLDIFSLWYLGVSVIGISIIHKISKVKAAVAVLLPWGIMIGISLVTMMFRG